MTFHGLDRCRLTLPVALATGVAVIVSGALGATQSQTPITFTDVIRSLRMVSTTLFSV